MIKIKIEQVTTKDYGAVENYVVNEEVVKDGQGNVAYVDEDSYGGSGRRQKALTNKRYETRDITKQTSVTVTLLEQEIVVDTEFDLKAVIAAINNMGGRK